MVSSDPKGARTVTIPDPRPVTVQRADGHYIRGMICTTCGHPSAVRTPWCPRCHSDMAEKLFGPAGTVWSSTLVHVRLPNRTPPYSLAYVDLEDGPRVLAHVSPSDQRLPIGQPVRLLAATAGGDVQVAAS